MTTALDELRKAICDCQIGYPYASEDCPHKAKLALVDQAVEEARAPASAMREVLEAIRSSKTFGMLSINLRNRVHGALRR